ncbi:hypothetical protein BpHYR1_029973 [Brachionus plicatilis]|uniref:Uncharacterized protein n=1 Tax=Brachionus plicatilis TaxID=10195 RepID=A0A3M7Q473_BRAPC|nr:hypothetical protein BpHYR1_029973 [Brachionus plicatilis]
MDRGEEKLEIKALYEKINKFSSQKGSKFISTLISNNKITYSICMKKAKREGSKEGRQKYIEGSFRRSS